MFRQKKCIVDNLNKDFIHDLTFAALLKYTPKQKILLPETHNWADPMAQKYFSGM